MCASVLDTKSPSLKQDHASVRTPMIPSTLGRDPTEARGLGSYLESAFTKMGQGFVLEMRKNIFEMFPGSIHPNQSAQGALGS